MMQYSPCDIANKVCTVQFLNPSTYEKVYFDHYSDTAAVKHVRFGCLHLDTMSGGDAGVSGAGVRPSFHAFHGRTLCPLWIRHSVNGGFLQQLRYVNGSA